MTRDMSDFHALAEKQLRALFPWTDADSADAGAAYADVDARFLANCSRIRNKYYANATLLSPLQSCQLARLGSKDDRRLARASLRNLHGRRNRGGRIAPDSRNKRARLRYRRRL